MKTTIETTIERVSAIVSTAWVTVNFVAAVWVLFFVQFVFGVDAYNSVRALFVLYPADWYLNDPGWGWVMYIGGVAGYWLVHGSWAHIINNSATVLLMGYFVERRFVSGGLGRRDYLVFALGLGVLTGEAISIAWSINGFTWGKSAGAMGMSGIAYGIAGATLTISARIPVWVLAVAVFDLVMLTDQVILRWEGGLSRPDIAHISAAVAGLCLGVIVSRCWLAKESDDRPMPSLSVRVLSAAGYIVPFVAPVILLVTRRRNAAFSRAHGLQAVVLWGGLLIYFAALVFLNAHIMSIADRGVGYWLGPWAWHVSAACLLTLALHGGRGGRTLRWFSSRLDGQ